MNNWKERLASLAPAAVALLLLVAAAALFGPWLWAKPPPQQPESGPVWVVCIDSTKSTDTALVDSEDKETVRESYLPGLRKVVREAKASHGSFYVSGCGRNAIGRVNWKDNTTFRVNDPNDELDKSIEDVMLDGRVKKINESIEEIVKTKSYGSGTPLGEMLAVMAGRCESLNEPCIAYLFTDGEWADSGLKVSDGVTGKERKDYVEAYESDLEGFNGAKVYFAGIGYGTKHMGTKGTGAAKEVATDMVEAAGGTVVFWNVGSPPSSTGSAR